jgi:hypothetical protein
MLLLRAAQVCAAQACSAALLVVRLLLRAQVSAAQAWAAALLVMLLLRMAQVCAAQAWAAVPLTEHPLLLLVQAWLVPPSAPLQLAA